MQSFDVSFNSPQCGWMSIGFGNSAGEFHSTTAAHPYRQALSEILTVAADMLTDESFQRVIKWNRDPEEFDFVFVKSGDQVSFEIFEFPTAERIESTKELRFMHRGDVLSFSRAFHGTFAQLLADRETDEFEINWQMPFPDREFKRLSDMIARF